VPSNGSEQRLQAIHQPDAGNDNAVKLCFTAFFSVKTGKGEKASDGRSPAHFQWQRQP
jgi:hypothetical protein